MGFLAMLNGTSNGISSKRNKRLINSTVNDSAINVGKCKNLIRRTKWYDFNTKFQSLIKKIQSN